MARIERVRIVHHRCLVDFDFTPEPINLLVGESGSGKSTLFEVLAGIQDLVQRGQGVPYKETPRYARASRNSAATVRLAAQAFAAGPRAGEETVVASLADARREVARLPR